MIKIGIIGTDSSHADVFSKIINEDKIFEDIQVTHIFGLNEGETNRVLSKVPIENVVSSPDEMVGEVDAVMILFRDGNLHFSYARPFIEAKIAVWIDKPLTIDYDEEKQLISLANANNTLLMGGSALKYQQNVKQIKNNIITGEVGNVLSATINFPGNLCSQYNGLHFYAPHLCEIALEIFGYDPIGVYASKIAENNITVILSYLHFNITLNFVEAAEKKVIYVLGDKNYLLEEISTVGYEEAIKAFVSVLKGECQNDDPVKLTKSVKLINEICNSLKNSKAQKL